MKINKERRKRHKRPILLIVAGFLILGLFVLNFIGLFQKYNLEYYQFQQLVEKANWKELTLLPLILLSGVGLLLIRTWGWIVFTGSATLWIVHNLVLFIINPASITPGAIIQTVIVAIVFVYFIQKDIYSPYFNPHRLGWRLFHRYPLSLDAQVNDHAAVTRDVSRGGAFLVWPDSELEPGERVQIRINVGGFWFSSEGGVAVVRSGEGVGIAFRGMDEFTAREMELRLKALHRAVKRTYK